MEIAVLAGIWFAGRRSQKAAVSAPGALHIFDRRIQKESFTGFRRDANERIIEGIHTVPELEWIYERQLCRWKRGNNNHRPPQSRYMEL